MLNNIILCGRLVNSPELKTTPSGQSVTSFTLAVDRDYKSNGDKVTDFINLVAWRGTAEFISKYFTKGQMMIVRGSLQTRSYQTQGGENRRVTEVLAEAVYFTGESKKPATEQNRGPTDDFEEIDPDEDLPF